MKKFMTFILAALIVVSVVSAANIVRQDIRIQTKGYENQVIKIDGKLQEQNIIVEMNYKERCLDCNFRPFIGNGRIRYYGFNDGLRQTLEVKRIKPNKLIFEDNYFGLEGKADVVITYKERFGREVYNDVPIEIFLNKNNNKLAFRVLDSTIEDINVLWR